jgi:hypothetical protein
VIVASFLGWHMEDKEDGNEREVKHFRSKLGSQAALAVLAIASFLAFVSVLWQHTSSSAAAVMGQNLSYRTVKGHGASVAMVFGVWWSVSESSCDCSDSYYDF